MKSSTTMPPLMKCKQGEATSSKQANDKQVVEGSDKIPTAPRPKVKLLWKDTIKWYNTFVPYGRYISEMGINISALDRNFPMCLSR